MVVTIEFNGKKYVSPPITVGVEKRLARLRRDAGNMAVKAAELQEKAGELAELEETPDNKALIKEVMAEYNAVEEALEKTADTRDEILVQVFGNQFTLDDLENYCPKEEAARVMQVLQGTAQQIAEKNG